MSIKHLLILLFVVLYSTNCYSQKSKRLAKKGIVTQTNYSSKIPFRYENKHIFIDVSINGEVYNFLFDTGFDFSAIDLNHIKNIDFKKIVKVNASGSSFKKHKIQLIEISTISISDIDFREIGSAIMDLSFINKDYPCSSKPIAGVIGANILRKTNWQINYKNREILVSDTMLNFNISDNAFEFEIIPKSVGSPLVNVTINGIDKKFTLDTGSSGKITTGTEFREELNLTNNKINYISLTKEDKLKKSYTNYYALIEQIDIGDLKLKRQLISLEKRVSSLIGNKLFENFTITIDWTNNTFFLDPIKDIIEAAFFDYEVLLKPNYLTNKIEINGFYGNAIAEKKYKIGTEILTINEKDVSNLSTQELCDFWKNDWEEIKLKRKIVIETETSKIELVKIDLLLK